MDPREMTTGEREAWDAGARAMRERAAQAVEDVRVGWDRAEPGPTWKTGASELLGAVCGVLEDLPLPEPGQ